MLAQNVRVDAKGHGWVGVAKPGRHHVHRNPGQKQRGRVQVVQIVHVGARGWPHMVTPRSFRGRSWPGTNERTNARNGPGTLRT